MKEQKLAAVRAEIAAERAASLGLSARRLRTTLSVLRGFDTDAGAGTTRDRLVTDAADACLAHIVQRESLGFGARDAEEVRKDFEVPDEVWNAMGRADAVTEQ